MIKRISLILLIFSLMFVTVGCWDKVELNDRAFVISLGIDKYNKKNDKSSEVTRAVESLEPRFSISLETPNISSFAGNDGGMEDSDKARAIKRAVASSISQATSAIDSSSSRRMYYGQTKTVILGNELLKDSQLLKGALDSLERKNDFNRRLILLASENSPLDIFEADTPGEPLLGFYVSKFYKNSNNNVSTTLKADLNTVLKQLRSNSNAVIPKISKGDKEIILDGLAIISDYELVDFLSSEETRGYMWIMGEGNGRRVSASYNEISVPFRVTKNTAKIYFAQLQNKLHCNIDIYCEGNIEEYDITDSLYDEKTLFAIENKLSDSIKEDINLFFSKVREELNVDSIDLKGILKKKNYNLWDKYHNDWEKIYQNELIINSNVSVNIRNIGVVK